MKPEKLSDQQDGTTSIKYFSQDSMKTIQNLPENM